MHNNWILVASQAGSQVFSVTNRRKKLELVTKIENPNGRKKDQDLVTDRPGFSVKDGRGGGRALVHEDSAKEHAATQYAKSVIDVLEEGRKANKYQKLIIVAEPSFESYLKVHIKPKLENTVFQTIHKNYFSMNKEEIYERIKEQVLYSFPP